jgi:hypothetical protein
MIGHRKSQTVKGGQERLDTLARMVGFAVLLGGTWTLSAPASAAYYYRPMIARPVFIPAARPYIAPMMRPAYRPYVRPIVRMARRPYIPAPHRMPRYSAPHVMQQFARPPVYRVPSASSNLYGHANSAPITVVRPVLRPNVPQQGSVQIRAQTFSPASNYTSPVTAKASPPSTPTSSAPFVVKAPQVTSPSINSSNAVSTPAPSQNPSASVNTIYTIRNSTQTMPSNTNAAGSSAATKSSAASNLLNSKPIQILGNSAIAGLGSIAGDVGAIAKSAAVNGMLPSSAVANLSKAATAAKIVGYAADGVEVYAAFKTGGPTLTDKMLAGGSALSEVVAVNAAGAAGTRYGGPAVGAFAAVGTQATVDAANTYLAPKVGAALYSAGLYPGAAADAQYLQQSAAQTAQLQARVSAANTASSQPTTSSTILSYGAPSQPMTADEFNQVILK